MKMFRFVSQKKASYRNSEKYFSKKMIVSLRKRLLYFFFRGSIPLLFLIMLHTVFILSFHYTKWSF